MPIASVFWKARGRSAKSVNEVSNGGDGGEQWSIWNIVAFGVLVAASLYSAIWGYRVAGLLAIIFGVRALVGRRIPYGIEGRAPSGYLTGASAVIVGLLTGALGVLFIVAPHLVDEVLKDSGR